MFEEVNESPDPRRSSAAESDAELEVEPETETEAEAEEEDAELTEWKVALREQFESWLETIEAIPEADPSEEVDAPDLYSFYEQLAAANTETRKANRRTVEAFSQWGETLARFESQLAPLRETAAQLAAVQSKENELPRSHCLVLIELLDRMHRLARAFQATPQKKGWWSGNDPAWRQAWETQRQAFAILLSHFEEWLKKEGVARIEVMGQPFDPAVMTAVAAVPDAKRPAQTVLEEVAAGYRRRGELLRPAQVKVSVGG
jgi:molecular chaperone GrpE (heat shock protein)